MEGKDDSMDGWKKHCPEIMELPHLLDGTK